MKGALSDSSSLFCTRLQQQLFPGSTYAVVSGGDPANITDLTFEQLREFHRLHYHPTNARFYTYGDYPVELHLEYLNGLLSRFERLSEPPQSNLICNRFPGPRRVHASCAPDTSKFTSSFIYIFIYALICVFIVGDPNKQMKAAVSYVLPERKNGYEDFLLRLAMGLLIDGQSSPMYRALIESNIGADYAPGTGLDTSTRQSSFTVGVQGASSNDINVAVDVENAVLGTIRRLVDWSEGFSPRQIEASLHQIELSLRHVSFFISIIITIIIIIIN
jgi:Zn-dependent M16 (insulinase) family peptidase